VLLAGAGTLTAGLAFGGYLQLRLTNATEEYDGSSWTAGGSLGTASRTSIWQLCNTNSSFSIVEVMFQQQQVLQNYMMVQVGLTSSVYFSKNC
jgi:hypothetical protein